MPTTAETIGRIIVQGKGRPLFFHADDFSNFLPAKYRKEIKSDNEEGRFAFWFSNLPERFFDNFSLPEGGELDSISLGDLCVGAAVSRIEVAPVMVFFNRSEVSIEFHVPRVKEYIKECVRVATLPTKEMFVFMPKRLSPVEQEIVVYAAEKFGVQAILSRQPEAVEEN